MEASAPLVSRPSNATTKKKAAVKGKRVKHGKFQARRKVKAPPLPEPEPEPVAVEPVEEQQPEKKRARALDMKDVTSRASALSPAPATRPRPKLNVSWQAQFMALVEKRAEAYLPEDRKEAYMKRFIPALSSKLAKVFLNRETEGPKGPQTENPKNTALRAKIKSLQAVVTGLKVEKAQWEAVRQQPVPVPAICTIDDSKSLAMGDGGVAVLCAAAGAVEDSLYIAGDDVGKSVRQAQSVLEDSLRATDKISRVVRARAFGEAPSVSGREHLAHLMGTAKVGAGATAAAVGGVGAGAVGAGAVGAGAVGAGAGAGAGAGVAGAPAVTAVPVPIEKITASISPVAHTTPAADVTQPADTPIEDETPDAQPFARHNKTPAVVSKILRGFR